MNKNIDYYLSKGFDLKMAEYFAKGRRIITEVIANDDFTLIISFDNGEKRLFDMNPLLKPDTIFRHLMDVSDFKRVYVDEDHCIAWDIDPNVDSNVVWNNKIDLCPDSCYVDSVPIR